MHATVATVDDLDLLAMTAMPAATMTAAMLYHDGLGARLRRRGTNGDANGRNGFRSGSSWKVVQAYRLCDFNAHAAALA